MSSKTKLLKLLIINNLEYFLACGVSVDDATSKLSPVEVYELLL